LQNADLRRLITNACYWGVGLEAQITNELKVDIVGEFKPTFFGFRNDPKFWPSQNLRPADFAK
jgi:hypothetical protein